MEKDVYPLEKFKEDKQFVFDKLEISENEFNQLLSLSPKTFLDYLSYVKNIPKPVIRLIEYTYKYLNKNK